MSKFKRMVALTVAAMILAGPARAADVTGAGSTFVFPILSKWSANYSAHNGTKVNYQSIGIDQRASKCVRQSPSVARQLSRI
jgi:phosphate transport system substrate-binding protein